MPRVVSVADVSCGLRLTGGGVRKGSFMVRFVGAFPLVHGDFSRLYDTDVVRYVREMSASELASYVPATDEVVSRISVLSLCDNLSLAHLRIVWARHIGRRGRTVRGVDKMRAVLGKHACSAVCTGVVVFWRPSNSVVNPFHVSDYTRVVGQQEFAMDVDESVEPIGEKRDWRFPPEPHSKRSFSKFVAEWADAVSEYSLRERACGVCGQLKVVADVQELAVDSDLLRVLCVPSVTRAERFHADDAVRSIDGPVLCSAGVYERDGRRYCAVCGLCLRALKRRSLPQLSLANGLWIGDVPEVVRNLRFVEKLVVARYRHNVCLAKVVKGGHKLSANVIVFGQPVAKLRMVLPPAREELDETLVILFTGSCAPLESDFKRTPFVVRRNHIWNALQWFKLNNDLYRDVILSEENLMTYPEDLPPVGYYYVPSQGMAPPESMSVDDMEPVKGSTEGCPVTVHCLTGAELSTMGYKTMVARALKHLREGGAVLAYGQSAEPEVPYGNPALYPGLFPWLFPYGLGGFENKLRVKRLGRTKHARALLMYHDLRFQQDANFPFMVFNQRQIQQSRKGGYLLAERKNFAGIADKVLSVDPNALDALVARGYEKGYVRPETAQEKACFELMAFVDHVWSHVSGSVTQKKYQSNEIRSMIYEYGAPTLFVTFSPAGHKNPICLYYCGLDIDLAAVSGGIPSYTERIKATCENPVACARFFQLFVKLFLEVILRVDKEEEGLFGKTEAYYGTVEEQGRKALHLHTLVWIANACSPQELRDRLLENKDDFRTRIICWMEGFHQGELSTGTLAEVSQRIRDKTKCDEWEPVDDEDTEASSSDPLYRLPPVPPPFASEAEVDAWFARVCEVTDEILARSNVHDQRHNQGCRRGRSKQCRARMPRDTRPATIVDLQSGALLLKKGEAWMNTFSLVMAYLFRCNTDVTCLLSGTAVRAILAYVADYVTKTTLKTHHIFEVIRIALTRHAAIVADCPTREEAARRLMNKVVNALTGRNEIGSLLTNHFLLGGKDYCTGCKFKPFFCYPYVRFVKGAWKEESVEDDNDSGTYEDKVCMARCGREIVPLRKLDDYIFRPLAYENWSLEDYLRWTDVKPKSRRKRKADDEHDNDSDGSELNRAISSDDDKEQPLRTLRASGECLISTHPRS